jgi:acyl-coenzyme A synthetase/AMP-(fatty) acid ligase
MIAPVLERPHQGDLLVAYGEREYRQNELRNFSLRLADSLGEKCGSTCLVHSDNPADIIVALDACIRSGAHLVIAHTSLPDAVYASLVERFQPAAIVEQGGVNVIGKCSSDSSEQTLFLMTSGTTGQPKIAAHRFERLVGSLKTAYQGQPRNWMLTYQPTGLAGLQVILSALLSGDRLYAPRIRTPSGFLATARDHAVTHVSGTPTFWRALLISCVNGLDFEQVTLGGEAVDQLILDRLHSAFPKGRISHTYASTEAGMVFAVHDGKAGFPLEWLETPNNGIELRIVDHHLHIRSNRIMRNYANIDKQPLQDDNWLMTRDRCEIRGDRVFIIGREDSTINVAGSKVYPAEIESFLLRQTGVAEARVFAVQNPITGALVGVEIVAEETASPEELRGRLIMACRQELPGFKVPRILKIVDHIDVGHSLKKG